MNCIHHGGVTRLRRLEIERLPGDQAFGTGGARKGGGGGERRGVGQPVTRRQRGQYLEAEREQGVAGQDRDRFSELFVGARLSAAQIVVIHAREIVVHERVGVHALERARRIQRDVAIRSMQSVVCPQAQEWTHPLPATQERIANGIAHACVMRREQVHETGEPRFH
jgi:hypothetical protein